VSCDRLALECRADLVALNAAIELIEGWQCASSKVRDRRTGTLRFWSDRLHIHPLSEEDLNSARFNSCASCSEVRRPSIDRRSTRRRKQGLCPSAG
jgi:hypothetical protein